MFCCSQEGLSNVYYVGSSLISVHIHIFVPKRLEKKYIYFKFAENKQGVLKLGLGF